MRKDKLLRSCDCVRKLGDIYSVGYMFDEYDGIEPHSVWHQIASGKTRAEAIKNYYKSMESN